MTLNELDSPATMNSLAAQINMPYTLTPGRATGIFIAELANRRLIGSRHGDVITVPALDFIGTTGAPADGFVEVGPAGTLQAFTTSSKGTVGLVLLDGTDSPLLHRIVGAGQAALEIGMRVAAVWAEQPSGTVLDLAGFSPARDADLSVPREVSDELGEPIQQIDYSMTLDYDHSYGHYYGTFFDGVRNDRRLRGIKCSECARVLLPPRGQCDVCFAPTSEWVDVADTGTIQASSIVHIEFVGQRLKPPYVYAEIVLDGSSTRLIHMVGGVDPDKAQTRAAPGARVKALWSERRTGSLADIEYFELI